MGLLNQEAAGGAGPAAEPPSVLESTLVCQGANNHSYVCEMGHCCRDTQCCSYYYELWWFWLVWTLIILLICCCVCQHRRSKQRFQQQRRQNEINLIAYREARNNSQLPLYLRFLPDYLLPTYEEVADIPALPPPPYTPQEFPPTDTLLYPLAPPSLPGNEVEEDDDEDDEDIDETPGSPQGGGDPLLGSTGPTTDHLLQTQVAPGQTGGGPGAQQDLTLTPARYRRFTGDSGIEVCDGQELWDQHGFLGREEQQEEEEDDVEEKEEEQVRKEEDVREDRAIARSPETDLERVTHTRAPR